MINLTPKILTAAYPFASQGRIALLLPGIQATMDKHGISETPLRAAHFLAQVGHESGELRYMEEIASGAAYEGRRDLGNTHKGDGKRFKGHGLIQCTGRANHQAFADYMGRPDIMLRPGLVGSDPMLCCEVAGWYWSVRKNLNPFADKDALITITKAINGGTNGLEDRRRLLGLAKRALR